MISVYSVANHEIENTISCMCMSLWVPRLQLCDRSTTNSGFAGVGSREHSAKDRGHQAAERSGTNINLNNLNLMIRPHFP